MATKSGFEFKEDSIMDDFRYGTNVATAHIEVRLGFLRKVFSILSCQLLLTTIVSAIFLNVDPIKTFVQQSAGLMFVSIIGVFIILIALMIKRHEYPANFILLSIFTILESYTLGTTVTFYDKDVVLQAFFLTLLVTGGLVLYTLQSKRDFSSLGAGLYAALVVLIFGGLLRLFFPNSDALEWCLSVGGALIFSLFIVFDVHMLMHKLSPEEYIVATVNLYLDIINLFLHILRMLSEAQKK